MGFVHEDEVGVPNPDQSLTEAQFLGFHDPWHRGIEWVITGGESGPGARPSHPSWYRGIRDACQEMRVAYSHKQNGMFAEGYRERAQGALENLVMFPDGRVNQDFPSLVRPLAGQVCLARMKGKHAAGRLLDSREWSQFPQAAS